MSPQVELAKNYGLSKKDLRKIRELVEEHEDEIRSAWNDHFGR